jgi:hypothetical protein
MMADIQQRANYRATRCGTTIPNAEIVGPAESVRSNNDIQPRYTMNPVVRYTFSDSLSMTLAMTIGRLAG